jgi:GAF domain-containing protein
MRRGQPIGVLFLRRNEVNPVSPEQIGLLTTFANQAVIAINNVGLFEQVQARSKELAQSNEELRSLGEGAVAALVGIGGWRYLRLI